MWYTESGYSLRYTKLCTPFHDEWKAFILCSSEIKNNFKIVNVTNCLEC